MSKNYKKIFDNHGKELTIKFDTQESANHFKSWLCGQGEQYYWDYMEYREQENEGDITAINFDYHTNNSTIVTKCGRVTK